MLNSSFSQTNGSTDLNCPSTDNKMITTVNNKIKEDFEILREK